MNKNYDFSDLIINKDVKVVLRNNKKYEGILKNISNKIDNIIDLNDPHYSKYDYIEVLSAKKIWEK